MATFLKDAEEIPLIEAKDAEEIPLIEVRKIVDYIAAHLTTKPHHETLSQAQEEFGVTEDLKHIENHWGIFYPDSNHQVIELINYSRNNGKVARCRGSGHSVKKSIFDKNGIDMVLGRELRSVQLVEKLKNGNAVFKVGGGCYIGKNPMDRYSKWENSLINQISKEGYGISIIGGISHQSISGFMLTGSSGGSLKYGFPETIREIEFINGKCEIKKVSKTEELDLFHAVGVSMGLFGIVVSITIEVDPIFFVKGVEKTVSEQDSLLQPGRLIPILRDVEYFHCNWMPQHGVNRVSEFTAHKTLITDPVEEYHQIVGNPFVAIGAAAILLFIDSMLKSEEQLPPEHLAIISTLLKLFYPLGKATFCDEWYKILASDDQAPVDTIMKLNFLEMWFPIDSADDVISILKDKVFTDIHKCGSLATEIYGSKTSPFWLSMSYEMDAVRFDKLRYAYDIGSPSHFYKYYWEALMGVKGIRFHWGKWMPENGEIFDNVTFNLNFLTKSYPKLIDWLKLRGEMDPDQVFVSDYWRKIFEIPPK